jgi:hypothetical protein
MPTNLTGSVDWLSELFSAHSASPLALTQIILVAVFLAIGYSLRWKLVGLLRAAMLPLVSLVFGPSLLSSGSLAPQVVEGVLKLRSDGVPYVDVITSKGKLHVVVSSETYLALNKIQSKSLESGLNHVDEMYLRGSILHESKIPKGIGSIRVGSDETGWTVLAMYSRVKNGSETYLLTAGHAWAAASLATNAYLDHQGKMVEIDFQKWAIEAYSHSEHLDFALVRVPNTVWSRLNVPALAVANPTPRGLITLHGYGELGQPCMSNGRVRSRVVRMFYHHNASTLPSWSGTPVLEKGKVVGIHVKASPMDGSNIAAYFQKVCLVKDESWSSVSDVSEREWTDDDDGTDIDDMTGAVVYYPGRRQKRRLKMRAHEFQSQYLNMTERELDPETLEFLARGVDDLWSSNSNRIVWADEDAGTKPSGNGLRSPEDFPRAPLRGGANDFPISDGLKASEAIAGRQMRASTPAVAVSATVVEEQLSSKVPAEPRSRSALKRSRRKQRKSGEQSPRSSDGSGLSGAQTPNSDLSCSKTDEGPSQKDLMEFMRAVKEQLMSIHEQVSREDSPTKSGKTGSKKTRKVKPSISESKDSTNAQ